jgi:PAS domain S-box-containing protein
MSIEQAEKSLAPSHGQALSAGLQEFRLNLELLSEAAMIYAIDGTILSVNSITARIFEADASEIIGKNLFSMGALKAEEARAALARLMRGEAIRFEVDFTSLKGHQHRLEVLHVPMFTATGEVERVLGFARDITEAKRTEGERALLAAIVESSEDAIVSLSTDLTILSWNRGAEKLLGFSADEAIGPPVTLYIPTDLRAYGMNLLREMMQHWTACRASRSRASGKTARRLTSGPYASESATQAAGCSGCRRSIVTSPHANRQNANRRCWRRWSKAPTTPSSASPRTSGSQAGTRARKDCSATRSRKYWDGLRSTSMFRRRTARRRKQ